MARQEKMAEDLYLPQLPCNDLRPKTCTSGLRPCLYLGPPTLDLYVWSQSKCIGVHSCFTPLPWQGGERGCAHAKSMYNRKPDQNGSNETSMN